MIKPFIRGALTKLLNRYHYKMVRPPAALRNCPGAAIELSLAILLESFVCREKRSPHILQIGANDGRDNDHLHNVLLKYDWPALLIEPQPDIFDRLKQTYSGKPNIFFANCAVSNKEGKASLFRLHSDFHKYYPHRPDGLASFDRNHILKHLPAERRCDAAITSVEVTLSSVSSLLSTHQFEKIDALVIDTEGYDWEILKMFDIPNRLPSIIQYEWQHLGSPVVEQSLDFLIQLGYRVHLLKTDVLACRGFDSDRYEFETKTLSP